MSGIIRRHGGVRRLWIGETTSALGTSVSSVVLPLTALAVLHASAFVVSLIAAATWAPWLLLGLPAGAWIDRMTNHRRLLIGCDLLSAALFASIPIAAAAGVLGVSQLLVVAFGAGACGVLFNTAYKTFLLDLVADPEDRAAANSLLQGSSSAAGIGGPGLGGLLAQLLGSATAVLADGASYLVSAWCLLRIRPPTGTTARAPADEPIRTQVMEGVRYLRRDPLLRPLVLFGGTANLALTGYQAILVVFLVRAVGLAPGVVGLLMALGSCGGLIGASVGNGLARRIGTGRALLLTKGLAAPFALLIPLTSGGWRAGFVVAGTLGVGIGVVAGNVVSTSFGQAYTPPQLFSRINATTNVFNYGTMPVGAVLGGAVAATLGLRDAMWAMTGLLPLTSLVLWISPLARLRDLPTEPPAAAPTGPGGGQPTAGPPPAGRPPAAAAPRPTARLPVGPRSAARRGWYGWARRSPAGPTC